MANDFYRFSQMQSGRHRLDIRGDIVPTKPWFAADYNIVCTGGTDFVDALKAIDGEPLTVVIDSCGGDVGAGVSMYEALRQRKGETKCVVLRAYSSATLPLAAIPKGNRLISPAGTMLIHSPTATAYDATATDFDAAANYMRAIEQAVITAYMEACGKPEGELRSLIQAETTWSAQEAIDNGFCDRILQPGEMAEMNGNLAAASMTASREATMTMLQMAVKADEEARERAEIIRALESINRSGLQPTSLDK